MKILKHGSPKAKETIPRHFVCPECGCEFIANEGEYSIWAARYLGYMGNGQTVETKCPECGKRIQGEKVLVSGDNGHCIIERWTNGEPYINEQK